MAKLSLIIACATVILATTFTKAERKVPYQERTCVIQETCHRRFRLIDEGLGAPNFPKLLNGNNKLSLDCEASDEAERCLPDNSNCNAVYYFRALLRGWNRLCAMKTQVERVPNCFRSNDLFNKITGCNPKNNAALLQCIEDNVSSLSACGDTGGQIFKDLVKALFFHDDKQ